MTGRTHILGGVTAGLIYTTFFMPENMLLFGGTVALSTIGGLMPDIDHPSSKAGKKAGPLSTIINKIFGHRGFLHTPLFIFLFFILFFYFLTNKNLNYYTPLLYGYCIGYVSHLFLDLLTVSGIPLFFPFFKKKISITKLRTGGIGEDVTRGLIVIVLIALTINAGTIFIF